MLRFLTAGESHGKGLVGIIEGIPAGLEIDRSYIEYHLKRRQSGYGRGGRMKIEQDKVEIISGVRHGRTIGSPLSLYIENRDWKNWQDLMSVEKVSTPVRTVTKPRPGHADLAGILKYNESDIRNILERSSARETAMRVALGSVTRRFLEEFGIFIGSYVLSIGGIGFPPDGMKDSWADKERLKELHKKAEQSSVRCPEEGYTSEIERLIDRASVEGDTLGGIFEVFAINVPPGLGSYIQWDKRLNSMLASSVMSIQAVKSVEIGLGNISGVLRGSQVMDEIYYSDGYLRKTNFLGGIEGGISNGMPVIIRATMKPIPTLKKPLRSVDIITHEPHEASYERSDVCAVPACSVIAESMVSIILTMAFLEKFGGDSISETMRNYMAYMEGVKKK